MATNVNVFMQHPNAETDHTKGDTMLVKVTGDVTEEHEVKHHYVKRRGKHIGNPQDRPRTPITSYNIGTSGYHAWGRPSDRVE